MQIIMREWRQKNPGNDEKTIIEARKLQNELLKNADSQAGTGCRRRSDPDTIADHASDDFEHWTTPKLLRDRRRNGLLLAGEDRIILRRPPHSTNP